LSLYIKAGRINNDYYIQTTICLPPHATHRSEQVNRLCPPFLPVLIVPEEHIGSLLRPDELVKKRYAVADKSASSEELKPVEEKAIRDIVKLEQECGIHSITNGEYSRHQFWGLYEPG
jgi:hypothetical protein